MGAMFRYKYVGSINNLKYILLRVLNLILDLSFSMVFNDRLLVGFVP